MCPKKGINPTILLWGWDWDHQSYSREGSGFLGNQESWTNYSDQTARGINPQNVVKISKGVVFFRMCLKTNQVPGNSALVTCLWDGEFKHDPNSKVISYSRPPTIGDRNSSEKFLVGG